MHTITANSNKAGNACTIDRDFGSNTLDLVNLLGDEKVFNAAVRAFSISLQNAMRNALDAGKSPEEAQEIGRNWQPEAPRVAGPKKPAAGRSISTIAKLIKSGKLTKEEVLQQLMDAAEGSVEDQVE